MSPTAEVVQVIYTVLLFIVLAAMLFIGFREIFRKRQDGS